MSQVLAMATKLQEAEETIQQLEQALGRKSPPTASVEVGKQDLVSVSASPPQPVTPGEVRSDLSLDAKGQVGIDAHVL